MSEPTALEVPKGTGMIRIFSHYVPLRALFLLTFEILLVSIVVLVGLGAGTAPSELVSASPVPLYAKGLLLAFCVVTVMTAVGLYDEDASDGVRATVLRMVFAFVLGLIVLSMVFILIPDVRISNGSLVFVLAWALGTCLAARLLLLTWIAPSAFQRRVLVLGTGSRAASIAELVKGRDAARHIKIVGFVPQQSAHHHVEEASVLPQADSLLASIRKHRVDEIVIAVRDRRGGALPIQELLECRLRGIPVMDLATFFERERCQLHLESLNMSWMIFGEGFRQGFVRESVKRLFDVVVSAMLVVVTFPIMLVTAMAILIENGGPVLYRQERVGQGGRVFTICKFRSMRNDAERDGKPRWAGANDDRTTRIGRIIRKLRIDELPQVFNVLKGDMSFVGPRPERPFFVEQLASKIPYYNARHSIKPGITGWAQVRYPYGASLDDAVEKLQYDLYYVKNHTLFLDIMVLISTVQVVLWGKGAR
jgi:sugar transferase (PEP-CTERM system associated)